MCGGGYAPPIASRSFFEGYAPNSGLALRFVGPKPTEGTAQDIKGAPTAGHSHRRTSGGEAEFETPNTFEAKLIFCLGSLDSWLARFDRKLSTLTQPPHLAFDLYE